MATPGQGPQGEVPGDDRDRAPAIRRVRPGDRPALEDFYETLSPASRRARFMSSAAHLSSRLAGTFCTPDHMHGEGYVAVVPGATTGTERIVGHLCLEPAGPNAIELAVAVADDQQGRGTGRSLFESAIAWARAHGLQAIIASALVDNTRVLRLLSSSPYGARVSQADGGIVDVTIPLVPDLPRDLSCFPPEVRRRRRARCVSTGREGASRACRVVWRRRPPPGHGAGG